MSTVIETHAQQAANEIADMFVMGFCDDRMVSDISSIIQKHNERIVLECARQCIRYDPLPDEWSHESEYAESRVARNCAVAIEEHFGVTPKSLRS